MSMIEQGSVSASASFMPAGSSLIEQTTPRLLISSLDDFADRLLFVSLLVTLFAAPFEVGYPPLGHLFFAPSGTSAASVSFTNLQVVLLVLTAALALRLAVSAGARRRIARLPLALPIAGFLAISVASTAFSEYTWLGAAFVYRICMGAVVFASVGEALRQRRRLLAALAAFVTSALVSACMGLLEFVPWLNVQPLLKPFKPQPTTAGGMLRLSGSFDYANGAAVYFEIALPVLLALGLLVTSGALRSRALPVDLGSVPVSLVRRRPRLRAAQFGLYAAVGLLASALILTFSRAAWVDLVMEIGVIAGAGYLLPRLSGEPGTGFVWKLIRKPLAISAGIIALAALFVSGTNPLFLLRLTTENDGAWYMYELRQLSSISELPANATVIVPVSLTNPGPMYWYAGGGPVVKLSYHWRKPADAHYAVFDGLRTRLFQDVAPGQTVLVDARLQAPPAAGEYLLEWDLVQGKGTWFSQKSNMPLASQKVLVDPPGLAGRPQRQLLPEDYAPVSVQEIEGADTSTVPRSELWRVAFTMFQSHLLTGVGPDGFPVLYGKFAGKSQWDTSLYTNNTYIEMFTDLGLPGGLAFLLLVALALWRALHNISLRFPQAQKASATTLATWLVCLGATASLIGFVIHGLVDYFLFSTPLYIAVWFILGVSVLWPGLIQTPDSN